MAGRKDYLVGAITIFQIIARLFPEIALSFLIKPATCHMCKLTSRLDIDLRNPIYLRPVTVSALV